MLTMFDSIDPGNLPAGTGYAYAGYVDGEWPDYAAITAKFPHARILSITVLGNTTADCLDVESGDATPEQALAWVARRLAVGTWKPCIYASVSALQPWLDELEAAASELSLIRIWTAHYGAGQHICGPDTCKLLTVPADGTQWTDNALGISLDESVLLDDFFGSAPVPAPTPVPAWETMMMNSLPTLSLGATDTKQPWMVKRIQGLCLALLANGLTIDGSFGPATEAAVKSIQADHDVTVDGVVGPETWSVLVTGAF
jgi:peptidoglycan hydrolase-like protein with peptidoglycan-binding domain